MTPEDRDRELASLFEAERAADEGTAPDLRALLDRSVATRPRFRAGCVLLPAAAVAIVIAIVVGARLLRSGDAASSRDRSTGATTTLAEWRSPTEFLLNTPGSEIWTRVPSLGSIPLPAASPLDPSPTKGVDR